MRRVLLTSAAFLLLIGCRGQTFTATFDLTVRTDDDIRHSLLLTASERVMERMVYALEESVPTIRLERSDETPRMAITVEKEETMYFLQENLSRPIEFRIMLEADEDEEPDISNEQYGAFMYTEITEERIDWIQADTVTDEEGILSITFDEEGKQLLSQLFAENAGKRIGLFVRGGLVSIYMISPEDSDREDIMISGIPSPDLARVFADDVNVGTYVTFIPVP